LQRYFGIINQTNIDLARDELISLFKTAGARLTRCEPNELIVTAEITGEPNSISRRAAFTKYFAKQLDEDLYNQLKGKTFRCIPYTGIKDLKFQNIVEKIKKNGQAKVCLNNPDFVIIFYSPLNLAGLLNLPKNNWNKIALTKRLFFHPSSLDPKYCRCMVNLACAKMGETLLDPFCGSGGILTEARDSGLKTIGIDIRERMCKGARLNGLSDVICANAFDLPVKLSHVQVIVTDIPYGQSTHISNGWSPKRILSELILSAGKSCKKSVIMCRLNELEQIPELTGNWRIYKIRRHKSLTRCIICKTDA
jgi:putative methyltransferase (TIGR01177 family)